ncbi:MAG: hypothetical protein LBV59_05980 [Sphingobacterium sp.]|jgi:transcriptional regulator with XRE-family HTH domain|uniref:hypothetical protein n=1 Tax=Sphingobacterium sp. TaxID=341027 RepID=UPI002848C3F8|nr:hypothetical protein [Sphingobacterium sp.]MDR3007463.1 hypothetical protein [Sphingobacterium sp.]
MEKITDHALANLISNRITELIDLTELPLEGIANFTGISYSTLRSIYRKSRSLSLDTFARLCTPFSIQLTDFFNPQKKLSVAAKDLSELIAFKSAFFQKLEQQQPLHKAISRSEGTNTENRQQREFILQLIQTSGYFSTARTIDQMVVDFEQVYHIKFSPDRLSALLKKYIGLELLEKKVVPKTERKPGDARRPYFYYRNEKLDL